MRSGKRIVNGGGEDYGRFVNERREGIVEDGSMRGGRLVQKVVNEERERVVKGG